LTGFYTMFVNKLKTVADLEISTIL